jgi:hypothetical protein
MQRFAVQKFLQKAEFNSGDIVIGAIDPIENEGFLKIKSGFDTVKLPFYSLSINNFRANAVHQLNSIRTACDEMIEFLSTLPKADGEGLPAIGSGNKIRLNTDGSDAVREPD